MNYPEIQSLINGYIHAIHTQDETEFKSLFVKECPTLISIGSLFTGIDSIYDDFVIGALQQKYQSIELIQEEDLTIRLLDDTTAIVLFRYHTECIMREDGSFYGIQGMETQVLKKENEQWKIAHIHYSKVS